MKVLQRLDRWRNGKANGRHKEEAPAPALWSPSAAIGPARLPRVLILSASVGVGHVRAAEALELALRQAAPEVFVRNVDVLTLATAPFRRCYGQMYTDLIDLAPQVLGFFYRLMDRPETPPSPFWDDLRVSLEMMSLRPLVHLLTSEPWDLVINTHFLSGEIIGSLRRQGRVNLPQVMVTTDFETHRLWMTPPCEHYYTATDEAGQYLQFFGVPAANVTTTGIPIHPVFSRTKDRAGCLARQGLMGDRPVLLQLAGGAGVGPIQETFRALLGIEVPVELVVVTGRNARAREGLLREPVPSRHRVQILGYTDQLDELMAVADLVVSKPGGLTTSETLARGAGLVVVNPVPGQEDRNSDYLLENGAAIKVNHIPTLAAKLTALLRDPKRVAEIKANSRRLGRPYAAFEVVRHALSLLPSSAYRGLPFTPGPPRSRIESSTGNGTMRGGDGNHVALRAALEPNLV